MKFRWLTRTSLFARMSLLFGLLVTVPLVISGIVLSLAGWKTIHDSGDQAVNIGAKALDETSGRFRGIAKEHLETAANRVAENGKQGLDRTSRKAVERGTEALQKNAEAMTREGERFMGTATRQMSDVGQKTLEKSLVDLRNSNQKSLQALRDQFNQQMNDELSNRSAGAREGLKKSLLELWRVSADRRALSIEDYAKKTQYLIVKSLQYPLRTVAVVNGDPPEAIRQLFETHVRKNFQPEIVRVVLVSSTGQELARVPETEEDEDWADAKNPTRQEFFAQRRPLPWIVATPRLDPRTNRWIQRVVHQVSSGDSAGDSASGTQASDAMETAMSGPRQPTSFIVVDYAMGSLVRDANPSLPAGMEVLVLQADTGQVLSATDPAKMGATSMTILAKLPKGKEADKFAQEQFTFEYTTGDGVAMQASARYWRSEDHCWTIVIQPDSSVLQPMTVMEKSISEAWRSALAAVKEGGDSLIQERDRQARKRQEQLTTEAQREMKARQQHLAREVVQGFERYRRRSSEELQAALATDVDTMKKTAGDEMSRQALLLARDAHHRFTRETADETQHATDRIRAGAAAVANRAAGQMILNSGWLIPLFLVLALFLATLTARSLVKPIDQLVKGTQALAAGHYDQRIPVRGDDELARLAVAFNEMAGAIQQGREELQQSHDSLALEKVRIEGIVDASPDGLVMLEPSGHVAFINPTAATLLGVSPDQVPPAPFSPDLLPVLAAGRLRECLDRSRTAEGIQEYEFSEPQRCVLQIRAVRLSSCDHRECGTLLHLHDITRERVIDEMKSDFISLVSHELRTPLTSILGFSSYMLTGKLGEVGEAQRMALDSIHRQAKRLSAIISDFLDISRIESGKIEMKKEPVQVPSIAERVAQDLRPQAAEKNIRVNTRVDDGPYSLVAQGDEQRIAQVFTNLVGNALKFTERDGAVDIMLSRHNGELVCQVRDTGCGIPPDELDRVFDRFYQVEKVVTRKSGGTGLGLAIVKNIVEAHGGRVWIESQVGQGTTVSFTLPGQN